MQINEDVAALCDDTRNQILASVQWLSGNQKNLKRDLTSQQKQLKISAYQSQKLMWAAQRNPGIGVFGASQAGKSYLVSALARKENSRLIAVFGDIEVDFIEAINPEGGKESTGVVTRFTMEEFFSPQQDYPVCLELLSLTDILKILVNSYVYDLRHENDEKEDHDPVALEERIKELENFRSSQQTSAISEEEVYDLEQYCRHKLTNKNSNQRIGALARVDYWNRAARLAPFLSTAHLVGLFALLWEEMDTFSKIFSQLLDVHLQLGFARRVYCSMEGLCDISGENYERRDNGSIIDVETLLVGKLGEPDNNGDTVGVCTGDGSICRVPRHMLTALIAELVIKMKEQPAAFFDSTDLLDFPGARSRETRPKDEKYLDADEQPRLFLRGKVAYLFERYCDNKDLTSLLLCSGFENMEVISLPEMVFDWISVTHGTTPEERAGLRTTLFLVMTKFDMTAFRKAAGDGDTSTRWTTRLETSLIKPYNQVPNNWPERWQNDQVFDNCFCVRNPYYTREDIFEYNGTELGSQEIAVRDSAVTFVKELKKSFLSNSLVKTHVAHCEEMWDSFMDLNDGGISLLRSRLEERCRVDLKEQQLRIAINKIRQDATELLADFYITGDLDKELQRKKVLLEQLLKALSKVGPRFPEFIRLLQIDEEMLYDIYMRLDKVVPSAEMETESLEDKDSLQDKVDIADLFSDILGAASDSSQTTVEPSSAHPAVIPPKNDFPCRFVKAVKEFWDSSVIEYAEQQEVLSYFQIKKQELLDIFKELTIGMERIGLLEEITAEIRDTFNRRETDIEAQIWKSITPMCYRFNEYINWLGMGGYFAPAGTGISLQDILNKNQEHVVFAGVHSPDEFPVLSDNAPDYGRQYLFDWLMSLGKTILDNVPYYLDIQVSIDPASNKNLGDILESLTD